MERKFPYYERFDSIVKASVDKAVDKFLSKASLEDLRTLNLNDSVDLEKNVDLTGTIFNAAVINRMNRNDIGMATKTAMAIAPLFVHKPHNIEHKSERIVGHIIKAGWSSFGDNKILTDADVVSMTEPFNLVLGGVVYNLIDEKFAQLLHESSDETSSRYQTISTSWEVGFTDYHLCVGSKNVAEAEIISDPDEIERLKKYLRCNDGPGRLPDGRFVGRLIVGEVGDVLPVGMAFTTKPAAEVSGVLTTDWTDLLSSEEKAAMCEQNDASITNNEKNSSQTIETDVKNNSQAETTYMKFKTIKELLAAASSKEGLSEASVAEFLADQIEAKSKEWDAEQTKKLNAVKDTADKASQLELELNKANAKIAEVTATIESLQKDMSAKQKEADFQTRMTALASEYELSSKESELVAKQIRTLDEASYTSWFNTFSVFAEGKSKKSIAAAKEVADAKIQEEAKKIATEVSKASVTEPAKTAEVTKAAEVAKEKAAVETAAVALDKATEVAGQSVANTNDLTKGVDLKKEWASAFGGDNLKITV